MHNRCEHITSKNIFDILSSVDDILFDCDGTLWRGTELLPGAVSLINRLKHLGKRFGYITNNCHRTQREMVDELKRRGFPIFDPELVLCTARSTGLYLADKLPPNSNVFVLAPPSISKEFESVDIQTFTDTDFDGDFENLHARAVVCAHDKAFNYRRFDIATHLLMTRRDCLFLATNLDVTCPEAGGRFSPDCGAIAAALTTATGRKVDVCIGKPSAIMFEQVAKKLKIDPSKTLMVGDRCETDMAFASTIGARSLMVLTGASSLADAQSFATSPYEYHFSPNYIAPSVKFMSDLLN